MQTLAPCDEVVLSVAMRDGHLLSGEGGKGVARARLCGIIAAKARAVASPIALSRSSSVRNAWLLCNAVAIASPPFALMPLPHKSSASSRRALLP